MGPGRRPGSEEEVEVKGSELLMRFEGIAVRRVTGVKQWRTVGLLHIVHVPAPSATALPHK